MEHFALDNWRTPWAVCPEVVPTLSRLLVGDLTKIEAALTRTRAETPGESRSGSVAVIPLRGVITPRASLLSLLTGGGGGLEEFRGRLRAVVASDDVDSVVLDIDSPGGSTSLIAETAAEIRAAREIKPIVAVANTMAASAAYWLGAQANEMVATPSGLVGSIGSYLVHEDVSGALEDAGVKVTHIFAGKYKTEGNPAEPLSDEARAYAQSVVDENYGDFLADVAKGRGATVATVRDSYGEGRVLTARNALEAGMVDRVESIEHTLARLTSPEPARPAPALIAEANQLERPPAAQESDPEHADNERPNAEAEEGARRIRQLSAEHPIHVP